MTDLAGGSLGFGSLISRLVLRLALSAVLGTGGFQLLLNLFPFDDVRFKLVDLIDGSLVWSGEDVPIQVDQFLEV